MQGGFRCKLDYLLTSLKCYIKEHKRLLLCLMLTIIGGLVLGIVITSLRENVTSRYNYIVLISNEQFNLFGTFIKVLLLTIFGMALCYLQLYHKYFYCLPYIVLFYTAYRFGGRLVGIIIADKFVGFICIITFTIPMYWHMPNVYCCYCKLDCCYLYLQFLQDELWWQGISVQKHK